jgi:Domain of unknown function (DUF4345)
MSTPSSGRERRLLQITVALLAVVPILTGLAGVLHGLEPLDAQASLSRDGDSHVHYLSGLLLAIGLGFWSTVPRIEAQGPRFRLLTVLVLVGGFARLYGVALAGLPAAAMVGGLMLELAVTPALALWRERLERRSPRAAPVPASLCGPAVPRTT